MCSVDADNFEFEPMPATKLQNVATKCNKCKVEAPCVLLRKKDAYCKECFIAAASHKFKILLGKTKLVKPNDRVLVLYKIGHASTALLHLLRVGLDLQFSKRIMFKPMVLFLDEENVALSEKRRILNVIKKQVHHFNFKLYYVSLVQYLSNNNNVASIIQDMEADITIQENNETDFFKKNLPETWKNDIRDIELRQVLVKVAKNLNCKFIFTPEISSDTASNLLTNISLGRGRHVSIDTGFCDDRDEDVKILRPLRLFDMKELVFYNIFNNVAPVAFIGPMENPYSSVQSLMKKFVNDLQISYPATVTTILKTGDKLSVTGTKLGQKCDLCKGSLEDNAIQSSSAESIKFSHFVSTYANTNCSDSQKDNYNEMIQSFTQSTIPGSKYCFTCSKIADYIL